MITKYKGILIYKKIYKENDLFIRFISNTDEVISGIVYGGLSKKKRNIFQIGFYLNFNVNSYPNKPHAVDAELTQPYVSLIINDKYKLNCLICVTSLINLSIIEGQKIKNIFEIVDKFILVMFNNKKWLKDFFIFLFDLLKIIGYDIDYNNNKNNFFDYQTLEFTEKKTQNSIKFPYNFFENQINQSNKNTANIIFMIFENVFTKHHLSNFNLQLPNHYHLFKKIIIEKLN